MKILFYGESALNPTGFGAVNYHILKACSEVADVTHVASTHYHESYDREMYSWHIIGCDLVPPEERTIEHQRNLTNIEKHIKGLEWDVFFYQGDMGWNNDVLQWVAEIQREHPEKDSIFYMPIDGDVSIGYAFNVFGWCSAPVVYTNHARDVVGKYAPSIAEHMSVIWLGCEPETFYPLSPEEKRAARIRFFGEEYIDRFLVMNVNRNQMRKDLMRSMALFHKFHEKHDDASLYLHSVHTDVGGSLSFQAQLVGCDIYKKPAEVMFSGLDLSRPWTRETLNELYNAVDLLISTSYGEGWGLTTTEAMAAGTSVMVPANTANLDILGEPIDGLEWKRERGYGIKTGGDIDHTAFIYSNGSSMASFVHQDSFLDTMEYIYNHRHETREKAQVARDWCEQNAWERRESEWKQLLTMIKERQANYVPELTSTMIS